MKNIQNKVKDFFKISKETLKIFEKLYSALRNIDYVASFGIGYGANIEPDKNLINYKDN